MKHAWKWFVMALALPAALVWAGGLYLEVGNPSANAEAKAMRAVLVARVTSCHEPGKSVVTAAMVESKTGTLHRTELKVVPLKTVGTYAILGEVPKGVTIDLGVTNPEFDHYNPHVLIRTDEKGIQWNSFKHFGGKPPEARDFQISEN
ncbi:hypothetical protein [Bryobacter aggregatus]|uniref:hypothetical protein n=1 Tax=Bryobacter aggregatus TaxID=360054 RepID=UPI0012BAA9EA|nr:hypothetical protein [Bryobacter aggregatus]